LVVQVFDLLYLNGQSLTHESLSLRRRNLACVFDPVPGHLELVKQHNATTLGDVQKLLRDTVEAR
jgi:ATP-dependent DNA ligase